MSFEIIVVKIKYFEPSNFVTSMRICFANTVHLFCFGRVLVIEEEMMVALQFGCVNTSTTI